MVCEHTIQKYSDRIVELNNSEELSPQEDYEKSVLETRLHEHNNDNSFSFLNNSQKLQKLK